MRAPTPGWVLTQEGGLRGDCGHSRDSGLGQKETWAEPTPRQASWGWQCVMGTLSGEVGWSSLRGPLHGGRGPQWGGSGRDESAQAWSQSVGTPAPAPAPFHSQISLISTRIFFLLPQIRPREGHGVGNKTQDADPQGVGPSTDTQSGHPPARPQLSPPMDRAHICQAPGAQAACGLAILPPGASSLPLPLPSSPRSCLSGLIWGHFSGG